ncbi:MAG: IS66 family transposase, partial [Bacteroidales bacterium]|nr:IS66 family transposase [Bacteroidales bacterium]
MINIRRSEYEQLISRQEELIELVRQLRAEIELLKNGRNSKTSSTAPSQDISRSNAHSLRKSSGKPSGGQKGHPGHTLSMSATPDTIIDYFPEHCTCGCSLEAVLESGQTRRQVVDIPPLKPEYTEHRSHHKICPVCGRINAGHYPAGVNARIQYGPNVKSTVSYMSIYQYLPYKRMVRFFKDAFSLPLSEGSIDNILEEMSQKSEVAYQAIRDKISKSEVVGSDETGCRVNGKKHWFHVWQNNILTFIVSFASRGHKVIEEYFPGGFLHSFYVSDCWASQLKTKAKAHQLCIAHLLRELLNFEKSLQDTWSVKMKELIYRAIALKRTMLAEDYQNPPEEVAKLNRELDELLTVDISGFHQKEQAFINRLQKHRQSIFTFLIYPNVPPDNNGSERAIRNVKVKT